MTRISWSGFWEDRPVPPAMPSNCSSRLGSIVRTAALFGRKINQAESQLAFIEFLRLIADGHLEPEEAVRTLS